MIESFLVLSSQMQEVSLHRRGNRQSGCGYSASNPLRYVVDPPYIDGLGAGACRKTFEHEVENGIVLEAHRNRSVDEAKV